MSSPYRQSAEDILFVGITNALVALSSIILLPLLTKTLGTDDYGIWVQVQVAVSLGVGLVGLGLPVAVTRFLPARTDKEEIREEFYSVFCLVLFTALIAAIALFIGADFIADAVFTGATEVVRITALIILIWALDSLLLSYLRSFQQIRKYCLFTLIDIYGQIGLVAWLVAKGYGIVPLILAILAIRLLIFLVLLFLVKSQVGLGRPRFTRIQEYLDFSLPTIPAYIAAWAVSASDRYVIAYFLGATSVGVYSAGYSLGSFLMIFAAVLGIVLPPTLSRLYDQGKISEVKTPLSYLLKYFLAVAIPFVGGGALLGEPVLRMFSTGEIASQGYLIIPLVALGILAYGSYVIIGHVLLLVKKTKLMGLIWVIASALNLGLNILVIPRWGILGAAITTLLAYLLALGLGSYYALKEIKFAVPWRFIIKSLAASAVMGLAVWLIHPQSDSGVIITVIAGAIIYAGILLLLRGFTRGEFVFLKELIRGSLPPVTRNDDKQ